MTSQNYNNKTLDHENGEHDHPEDNLSSSSSSSLLPHHAVSPPSYPQWHNAAAGAMAGASARLATAPLDLIRIRAQLERGIVTYPRPSLWQKFVTIYKAEGGFLALFRGSVAATYLWIGYSMVQFSVYARIKDYLCDLQEQQQQQQQQQQQHRQLPSFLNPTSIAFISGAGAGLCATVSTYPFDICRTIFAARGVVPETTVAAASGSTTTATFQPPKSLVECATVMYHQPQGRGGFSAFFVGVRPAMVQIVPYMGLNFAIYDALTRGDRRIGLSGYAGSISGAISKMVVYPMDTVKKRLQYQSVFGSSPSNGMAGYYSGMWDCLVTMVRTEGFMSLYRGLVPSVLKTTIGSGLSFTFFRMTKNVLEEVHDHYYDSAAPSRIQ
jgi:solute carrier family 25 thiamine pyrophosphate transporter 19